MEVDMSTVLNKSQIHLLEMFSFCKSEDSFNELREVLSQFYAKKVEEEMDKLWENGEMNEEKLNEIRNSHYRTPYK